MLAVGSFLQALLQGECAVRVETAQMSEEEKYTWSIRCGARLRARRLRVVMRTDGLDFVVPGGHALSWGSAATTMSAPKVLLHIHEVAP